MTINPYNDIIPCNHEGSAFNTYEVQRMVVWQVAGESVSMEDMEPLEQPIEEESVEEMTFWIGFTLFGHFKPGWGAESGNPQYGRTDIRDFDTLEQAMEMLSWINGV